MSQDSSDSAPRRRSLFAIFVKALVWAAVWAIPLAVVWFAVHRDSRVEFLNFMSGDVGVAIVARMFAGNIVFLFLILFPCLFVLFLLPKDVPFFMGLACLSGFYVLLIIGMLLAEVLFLFPPNALVMIVPKGNPKEIVYLEDLQNPQLAIGFLDPKQEEIKTGKHTQNLINLSWLTETVTDGNHSTKIEYADNAQLLVDKISVGLLDVAVVSQYDLNKADLALVVGANNSGEIRDISDLVRPDVKVGLRGGKTSLGKRTQQLLFAAELDRRMTLKLSTQPSHLLKPQKTKLAQSAITVLTSPDPFTGVAGLWHIAESKPKQPTAKDLILGVQDGSIDATIVFTDDVLKKTDGGGWVEKYSGVKVIPIAPKRIAIDASRYPGHLSGWAYPVWWVNIKVRSLIAPLQQEEIRYALKLSLVSCCITTILCLWVAIPFGYMMSRYTFPGKTLIDAILDIPIVLPPLVIGLALLILFGTPLGKYFEESFFDTTYAIPSVILAQFSVACAFAVRTMRVTFDQISTRQEQVALTLGCTRGQAFWKVVLPESQRGIITAATLAWARSLGEFGPILVFSGATRMRTEVLPTTVYLELNVGNIEAAVAVSLLMVLAAAVVLLIVRLYGMERTLVQTK